MRHYNKLVEKYGLDFWHYSFDDLFISIVGNIYNEDKYVSLYTIDLELLAGFEKCCLSFGLYRFSGILRKRMGIYYKSDVDFTNRIGIMKIKYGHHKIYLRAKIDGMPRKHTLFSQTKNQYKNKLYAIIKSFDNDNLEQVNIIGRNIEYEQDDYFKQNPEYIKYKQERDKSDMGYFHRTDLYCEFFDDSLPDIYGWEIRDYLKDYLKDYLINGS